MIMNHHNSISHAHTILLRHSGILGVAWPPTVFYFSSKNGSTNHNETFSIVFLTKFLTNSWKEKIIGPFFFDLWMFETLRGSDDPRLGGWRIWWTLIYTNTAKSFLRCHVWWACTNNKCTDHSYFSTAIYDDHLTYVLVFPSLACMILINTKFWSVMSTYTVMSFLQWWWAYIVSRSFLHCHVWWSFYVHWSSIHCPVWWAIMWYGNCNH